MSNNSLITELSPLLEALCEDQLSSADTKHLESILRDSEEARWYYLCYMDLHGSLFWNAAGVGSAEALSSDEIPVASSSPSIDAKEIEVVPTPSRHELTERATTTKRGFRNNRTILKAGGVMASCLCLAIIGWWSLKKPNSNGVGSHLNQSVSSINPVDTNSISSTPSDRETAAVNHHSELNRSESPSVAKRHREVVLSDNTSDKGTVPGGNADGRIKTIAPVIPAPPETVQTELDSRSVVEGINDEIRKGWSDSDIKPSPIADDAEWFRRVCLDIVGRIPTIEEAEAFLADSKPEKRARMINSLLDDSAYARNFTTIWTNLLIGRRSVAHVDRGSLQKFLRMSFASNRSWNQIVYELIAAEGNNVENGATNFLIAHLNNDALPATAVTARLFLGQQLQCNQCHNNPFTKTQQTAFWELHSFFNQTASVPRHERDARTGAMRYVHTDLVTQDAGGPVFFETQNGLMKVAYPIFNGRAIDAGPETNRRASLARLMTEGDQPQLAAAFVNRMWSHFMGHGFTNDVDDIGPHSPASHPELLQLLSSQFIQSGYDTKQLIRWICNSEAYQLSSRTLTGNRDDEPTEGQAPRFSRMYVKSMTAEQLYDSFLVATKAHLGGTVDWTKAEEQRQKWLAQFVVDYETDENEESIEFDGTMNQALTLMNGALVEKALELSSGTFLDQIVRQRTDESKKIRQLCLAILSRPPTQTELSAMRKLTHDNSSSRGAKSPGRREPNAEGYQDLAWALLNSNEFTLVH